MKKLDNSQAGLPMATAPLGTVLRHIRQIVVSEITRSQTDAELLARFTVGRDQAAFAALVQRHGQIVWDVCRHQLRHEQDAEDAFQAVFLVLARNVATIRSPASLASWLYGVAYRTAQRAKRDAAIRRRHELRETLIPRTTPSSDADLREVLAVLDEEVQRLPDAYRAPFVLCCLQGKSRAEAAKELGWKEGTVAGRLGRARSRLQQRLTWRGIGLASMLGAVAVGQNVSTAAVPASLVESTTHAALLMAASSTAQASLVSAKVAALVRDVNLTIAIGKLNTVIVLLLVLGVAITGASLLYQQVAARPGPDAHNQAAPAGIMANEPADERPDDADRVVVTGRVRGPDGKPFSGARLHLAYYDAERRFLPVRTTSGNDGKFAFTFARAELARFAVERPGWSPQIVATADGYGPAWSEMNKSDTGSEQALRLVKDDVPIRGRVVDTEGRPIQGARVSLVRLQAFSGEDLTPYLQAITGKKLPPQATELRTRLPGQPDHVTSDVDGRFRLTNLGRERLVALSIEAPNIQHGSVVVMTRESKKIKAPASLYYEPFEIYGAAFDHVALPGRMLTGIVKDKATGQPVADVDVEGSGTNTRTVSDKDGRYELPGFAKSKAYSLYAFPARRGQPYFVASFKIPDTVGLDPIHTDIELERGIPLRVRVMDKATGRLVTKHLIVYYMPLFPNPYHRAAPGFSGTNSVHARADGSFTGVVWPGPGAICVRAQSGAYMPASVDPRAFFADARDPANKGQKMYGDKNDLLVSPPQNAQPEPIPQAQFHAIVLINPAKDAQALTEQITLDPGRVVTGTIVGPYGKPLSGVRVWGSKPEHGWESPSKKSTFTGTGLNPERPRTLLFRHDENRLAGALTIRGDEKEPVCVRLEPWGSVTGRLVDAKGQPRPDVELQSGYCRVSDPLDSFVAEQIKTDSNGRFHIDGLVPGRKYHFNVRVYDPAAAGTVIDGQAISGLTVKSGETRDLGDVRSRRLP